MTDIYLTNRTSLYLSHSAVTSLSETILSSHQSVQHVSRRIHLTEPSVCKKWLTTPQNSCPAFLASNIRLSWPNGTYVGSCDMCVTPADQAVAVTSAYGRIFLFLPIFRISKKYHARTLNGKSAMFKTERLRMSLQWPIFALFNPLKSQRSLYVPPVYHSPILRSAKQWVYVFCVDLRTDSDYFPIQH